MKTALLQISAGAVKDDNLLKAAAMTEEALRKGAQFVALPEIFNFRGDTRNSKGVAEAAERIPGKSTAAFFDLARKYKAYILAGSVFEKSADNKIFNTSVLINPKSEAIAKYRKINLFDARLGDKIIKESACFRPGRQLSAACVGEFKMGLSICYDLRFPLLYRRYAKLGCNVLTVPSCFTQKTGEAHWEVLLRARAIENLSYVIAPNQTGEDFRGIKTYGNSMIVSPWGEVIARASGGREEIVFAELDIKKVNEARAVLPGIK